MNNLIKIVSTLLWIILSFFIFFSSLKEQLVIPRKIQQNIATLFPQGWGFFTKSPRDPLLFAYTLKDNQKKAITMNNFSFETSFGISRKARFIGFEASDIVSLIPTEKWSNTIYKNFNNLKQKNYYQVHSNKHYIYFEKGKYLFILKPTVPYIWAKEGQESFTPISYIYVEII